MSGHDTKFVQRRNGQKTIARPRLEPSIGVFTEKLDTEGRGVMPMSASGQKRCFDRHPITSGLTPLTDIRGVRRHFRGAVSFRPGAARESRNTEEETVANPPNAPNPRGLGRAYL